MTEETTKTALDYLWNALEVLDPDGPVTRSDVWTLYRFAEYKVNFLERDGLTWRGESFKNNGWSVLLVVKVSEGKTPLVAFVTERSATACMRVFLRKLEEHTINWVPDKYA